MKVPDLLKSLALAELNNLFIGQTGEIEESKIPRIVLAINDGLLALYTRFLLRERSLVIRMRAGITNYHLKKKFAISNYDVGNMPTAWDAPYIIDTGTEPFREDVIRVLAVYNYAGTLLPMNDNIRPDSVFTPQATVLQVPFALDGKMLSVTFQAKHEAIPDSGYEDLDVDLPDFLIPALRYFVASSVYSQMNTQENTMKGQEYQMKYEAVCKEAVDMDLISTSVSTTNSRFEKNGWV